MSFSLLKIDSIQYDDQTSIRLCFILCYFSDTVHVLCIKPLLNLADILVARSIFKNDNCRS